MEARPHQNLCLADHMKMLLSSVEFVLGSYSKAICKSSRPKNFHHLFHLCHLYFKPHLAEVESYESHVQPPWCDNFHQLGWEQACPWFKKRTFCNGMMEIPCLTINHSIYSLSCNLVAFDQTYPQFGSFVTAYVMFLSSLISMPDVVSWFAERSIIVC